jgi:hypothetical protein
LIVDAECIDMIIKNKINKLIFFIVFTSMDSCVAYGEMLLEVEQEIAYSNKKKEVEKSEVSLKLEWSHRFYNNLDITMIPHLILDYDDSLKGVLSNPYDRADNFSSFNGPAYEDENHRVELLESYADIWLDSASLRIGKQQVVWGQADGLKVLDVVNPQNYREFNLSEFEDSRIPTWMINLQYPTGNDSSLQVLVIPDMTFNELADRGSQFEITSSELVPQPSSGVPISMVNTRRPENGVEAGIRWSLFLAGWDITANYFNYYQDTPVVYREVINSTVFVMPKYEPSQLLGFSANTAISDWVWKVEAGYVIDNYFIRNDLIKLGIQKSDEFLSVFAFDYHGLSDLMVSYQFFYSKILDYEDQVIRKDNSIRHTLLFKKNIWNETLELKFFTLFNQDYDDGQGRLKATYEINDYCSIWSGVDYFYGDRDGPFGQFEDASRFTLGWRWSY